MTSVLSPYLPWLENYFWNSNDFSQAAPWHDYFPVLFFQMDPGFSFAGTC